MSDLAGKMETMAATVDKINRVEMMKMPPSLQKTLIGDLTSGGGSLFSFTFFLILNFASLKLLIWINI